MLVASDDRTERARRRVGRVLGDKWRLDSLIGYGGMAAVYAATHRNNLRPVAIKVLHPELGAREELRRRFLREGYIANKVGHPGVVPVLDDGIDEDGSVYLVMDLVHGDTLHQAIRDAGGTLDEEEVLRVVERILDVLAVAHEAGVVHRDLKPENVFLTRDGEVKVLDFGIARLLEPEGDLKTQAGALVGTPTYMPPEQVAGKADEIDGRTDLWAVGAIMFVALSGKLVHEAPTPNALLLKAMTAPARKLADVAPDVSPEVAEVVNRALSFDKADRYQDAREMQQAVRQAALAPSRTPGAPRPLQVPRRSVASRARAMAALLLLAMAASAIFLVAWVRSSRARALAGGPPAAASAQPTPGPDDAGNDGALASIAPIPPPLDGGLDEDASSDAAVDDDASPDDDLDGGDDEEDEDEEEEDDDGGEPEVDLDGGPGGGPLVTPRPSPTKREVRPAQRPGAKKHTAPHRPRPKHKRHRRAPRHR